MEEKTCIVNVQRHYQIKADDCEHLNNHWTQPWFFKGIFAAVINSVKLNEYRVRGFIR